ncbi:MAG: DUF2911 domain-containing protein [Cyclobacteriaceae bacterium]|nr:DUF2911 domain-containing protein [Cyclobacteriaceae bacterium]UYN85181.1 MAG: DUF2911 domain-containing protein [Cyclobacteriaceae bacterium]
MKKVLPLLLVVACLAVEAQIQTPAASPAATVSTVVGLTDVKVTYARPKMKGRKIYGSGSDFLVPYGELWRTGANQGTVISFSDDVKVDGKDVKKGDYLLLTIPGASEWTVILYSDVAMGGNTAAYDKSKDAARFTVKPERLSERIETFTVNITDVSDDNTKANIQVAWENTSVKFGITVDYDAKVMKAIEAGTKVNPGNYIAAANYYFETGKDLKKALEWITIGIDTGNPNAFWNIHTKAKIQHALGDYKGALATAQLSMDKAKAAPSDFGYVKLNEDLIAKINAEMPKTPAKKK